MCCAKRMREKPRGSERRPYWVLAEGVHRVPALSVPLANGTLDHQYKWRRAGLSAGSGVCPAKSTPGPGRPAFLMDLGGVLARTSYQAAEHLAIKHGGNEIWATPAAPP